METRFRRAITQRLLQALRARTKSSPTASKTFGLRPKGNTPTAGNNTGASRLTTGASRPNKELAYGEQNLRPNGNPPSASNNTGASRLTMGASRPNKELAYGEQNLWPNGNPPSAGNNTGASRLLR